MKEFKKYISTILSAGLILSLFAGCSSSSANTAQTSTSSGTLATPTITNEVLNSSPETMVGTKGMFKGMTIGWSQRGIAGSEWWENLVRVGKAEADYLGIKLVVLDAQSNLSKQISDMDNLISQGVDSMIIDPQDSTGVLPEVKKVHIAKIPLTVVNCALDSTGSPFTFVSTNVFNSGYKGGMDLAKAYVAKYGWKDHVKALVLSSSPQEQESDNRRWGQVMGYNDYMLQKYGKTNLEIVAYKYYNWVPEQSLTATTDVLQAHPDLDIIFDACDGGCQGSVQALKSAGLLGKVMMTSIDGRKSVLQWIKDGTYDISADVSNDPRYQGKWAVFWAAYAAKGAVTPSTFYCPNPDATPANIDKYLNPNSKY